MNQNFDYTPENNETAFSQIPPDSGKSGDGYSTAAMVLGIVSVCCCTCCCCLSYFSIIPAVLAIVFAALSKNRTGGTMNGKAVAGMILGIIGCFLFAVEIITSISVSNNEELMSQINQILNEATTTAAFLFR